MTTALVHPADAEVAATRRPRLLRRARRPAAEDLVIIGNGMASYKLCERLAQRGPPPRFRITIFGEEPRPAYDRVHLTQQFKGRLPEKLLLAPTEWYREQQMELHLSDPVVLIDREARLVHSASGRSVPYGHLVFATGSRAFLPSIPGNKAPGVFVYRTMEDLQAIRGYALFSRRAAVVGGGLLGLEAACVLRELGLATWIVERGIGLMTRQLDPEAGDLLRLHIERLGIPVCLGRDTTRIETLGPDRLLHFSNGECLRVQLVIMAAGIRPRDELAAACGLRLGPRGGIEVNDLLQTSDERIFAIGECASHRKTIYGLAAPAFQMADALAATLCGRRGRFTGAGQSTWLKIPGLSVATLGDYQSQGETLISRATGGYRRLTVENGRLQGAVVIGDWAEQSRVQEVIERRGRVSRWQRARFLRTGRLWRGRAPLPVSEWPAAALVCNCMGVRRGVLSGACAEGCNTVEQLSRKTGAGTVCGSCRPLLAELLGSPALRHAMPGRKLLLAGSLGALGLGLAILVLPRIPVSDTVQGGWKMERLWLDAFWKQVSGFALMGLAGLSLLFSLRKRIKRVRAGEVGWWRAVHTVLGALALIVLVTHTGFRLGQNLNFVLMMNFLALALAGGLAGAVTGLEQRLGGPAGRRLRRAWTAAHILLLWPLPWLVLFHVMAAYLF